MAKLLLKFNNKHNAIKYLYLCIYTKPITKRNNLVLD